MRKADCPRNSLFSVKDEVHPNREVNPAQEDVPCCTMRFGSIAKVLQISSDMRQAKKTTSALVQREAQAQRAAAFCL